MTKIVKNVSVMCFHDELCQVYNALMTALSLLREGSKVTMFFGSRGINAVHRDKMVQLETTYPAKRFVWWTMPIETSGNSARQAFNDQVRAYARANGRVLFDIADVEAHDALGAKRTDVYGRELLWPDWTSDGGHLNGTGAQRVASAWWWLMARLGGWDPLGLQVSSIRPVSGPVAGGTPVTVRGNGFVAGATVAIGGVAATSVVVTGTTSLTAVTGAHATGLGDVTVGIPGPRSATLAQAFFFAPPPAAVELYTLSPCRLVDTRAAQAPALAASERRVFPVAGVCGVPPTATAVAVNVTAVVLMVNTLKDSFVSSRCETDPLMGESARNTPTTASGTAASGVNVVNSREWSCPKIYAFTCLCRASHPVNSALAAAVLA